MYLSINIKVHGSITEVSGTHTWNKVFVYWIGFCVVLLEWTKLLHIAVTLSAVAMNNDTADTKLY